MTLYSIKLNFYLLNLIEYKDFYGNSLPPQITVLILTLTLALKLTKLGEWGCDLNFLTSILF